MRQALQSRWGTAARQRGLAPRAPARRRLLTFVTAAPVAGGRRNLVSKICVTVPGGDRSGCSYTLCRRRAHLQDLAGPGRSGPEPAPELPAAAGPRRRVSVPARTHCSRPSKNRRAGCDARSWITHSLFICRFCCGVGFAARVAFRFGMPRRRRRGRSTWPPRRTRSVLLPCFALCFVVNAGDFSAEPEGDSGRRRVSRLAYKGCGPVVNQCGDVTRRGRRSRWLGRWPPVLLRTTASPDRPGLGVAQRRR